MVSTMKLSVSCPTRCAVPVRGTVSRPARIAPVVQLRSNKAEIDAKLQEAMKDAEDACKEGPSKPCAVAWDTVEELSAAAAHKKVDDAQPENSDPLEKYCQDNPDADECRVYDD